MGNAVTPEGLAFWDEATFRRVIGEELDRRMTVTTGAPPDLLTREQLADLLQVDVRTLRRLEREGEVPRPAKIGGRIDRWRRADVVAWLESGAPTLPPRRRAGSCVSKGNRRS